jgi:hypothetical protein
VYQQFLSLSSKRADSRIGGGVGAFCYPKFISQQEVAMSLLEGFEHMRLVKSAPSLGERLDRWVAEGHQRLTIARLRRFRQELEQAVGPEALWAAMQAPAVLILADVCDVLKLVEEERAAVLGTEGERALAEFLETRVHLPPKKGESPVINRRQSRVLCHVERCGSINLTTYRRLCPYWSDETLRLDLGRLVELGLLRTVTPRALITRGRTPRVKHNYLRRCHYRLHVER